MGKWRWVHAFCFVHLLLSTRVFGSYYTSLNRMKDLVYVEHELADKLLLYVTLESERLERLSEYLDDVQRGADWAKGMAEAYMSNPIDSFKTMDRLSRKWPSLNRELTRSAQNLDAKQDLEELISELMEVLPADVEEQKSAHALLKLQITYNISAARLSDGFGGAPRLTADDMFRIASWASHEWDFELAKHWLEELLIRLQLKLFNHHTVSMSAFWHHLSYAAYKVGDLETAVAASKKGLDIMPHSKDFKYNYDFYVWELHRSKTDPSARPVFVRQRDSDTEYINRMDVMCRGDDVMPANVRQRLTCSLSVPHPAFILKPLRVETIFDGDPYVVAYKNFLTDLEASQIIDIAGPRLGRAQAYDPRDGRMGTHEYRVSNNAWLGEDVYPLVRKIVRRVGLAVDLDMAYSEPLQVNNYGIAGSYDPHTDHAVTQGPEIFGVYGNWGNRIATALMYFSDVELGGQTAFVNTEKGVIVQAQKGTVVFWYNLKRNGSGNPRTEHAACPVLLGEKWVANLWIHERGQEFRRPCSLHAHE